MSRKQIEHNINQKLIFVTTLPGEDGNSLVFHVQHMPNFHPIAIFLDLYIIHPIFHLITMDLLRSSCLTACIIEKFILRTQTIVYKNF